MGLTYDKKGVKKHFKQGTGELLKTLGKQIGEMESFDEASLEKLYHSLAESMELPNAGKLIHPTRMAISGVPFGPGLFELMVQLGRDTVLRRMGKAIEFLEQREKDKVQGA